MAANDPRLTMLLQARVSVTVPALPVSVPTLVSAAVWVTAPVPPPTVVASSSSVLLAVASNTPPIVTAPAVGFALTLPDQQDRRLQRRAHHQDGPIAADDAEQPDCIVAPSLRHAILRRRGHLSDASVLVVRTSSAPASRMHRHTAAK